MIIPLPYFMGLACCVTSHLYSGASSLTAASGSTSMWLSPLSHCLPPSLSCYVMYPTHPHCSLSSVHYCMITPSISHQYSSYSPPPQKKKHFLSGGGGGVFYSFSYALTSKSMRCQLHNFVNKQ